MEFEITMEDLQRGHKFRFTTGQDKETWYEYRGGREFLPVSEWRETSKGYDYYARADKRFKRDRKCAITIDEENPTATFGPEKLHYIELAKTLKTLNGKIDEEIKALEYRWKDNGMLDFKYTLASASENYSTSGQENRERKVFLLLWGDIPASKRADYGSRSDGSYPYVIAKLRKSIDIDDMSAKASTISSTISIYNKGSTVTEWRRCTCYDKDPEYILPLYNEESEVSNEIYFATESIIKELFIARAKACEKHYNKIKHLKDREKENSL